MLNRSPSFPSSATGYGSSGSTKPSSSSSSSSAFTPSNGLLPGRELCITPLEAGLLSLSEGAENEEEGAGVKWFN